MAKSTGNVLGKVMEGIGKVPRNTKNVRKSIGKESRKCFKEKYKKNAQKALRKLKKNSRNLLGKYQKFLLTKMGK